MFQIQSRTSSLRSLLRMLAWRNERLSKHPFEGRFWLVDQKQQCKWRELNQRPNMADRIRTPKQIVSKPSVHVCGCRNDNVFQRQHPIDLYGPKATKESVLPLLERLTGFKCDINDGLLSKVCSPCYEKIMKFKKIRSFPTAGQRERRRWVRGCFELLVERKGALDVRA